MKTLGRILVIVVAFALMMGIIYSAVNAGGSSTNTPAFQRGGDGFAPNGTSSDNRDGGSGGGGGMILGLLKNTIIVAFITALVIFPKNWIQQRRKAVPVRIN